MRPLRAPRPAACIPALAAALAALACAPGTAWGHGALVASDPAPGQRLEQPPARIELRFSEGLSPRLSGADLIDAASGRALPARARVVGPRIVVVPSSPLPRGPYRVRWRSVSPSDGHPLEGSFDFGVGVAAARAESLQSDPLARGGWARWPARSALYAALLVFAGGLFATALRRGPGHGSWLAPPALRDQPAAAGLDAGAVQRRADSLIADAGVATVGLAAVVAAVEAFTAAGRISASALADFLAIGPAGPARLGVLGFAGLALALARLRPRAAALAAVAALACVTASSHADSAEPRALALAADLGHLLAGAVWLGAGAILVTAWWPALRGAGSSARRAVARVVLPAFGALALPAFLVVVVTGTVRAVIELGSVSALWSTSYGVVLCVKVALVAAAGAVAYVHTRRLRPRLLAANPHPPAATERAHWRLLLAEPLLGLAVVAAAGLLVAFPLPPRQLALAQAPGRALSSDCSPCPAPAPRAGELAVADLAGTRVVAAYVRRQPGRLGGRVVLLDRRGRPARAPLRVAGVTRWGECGPGCRSFSRLDSGSQALEVAVWEAGRWHSVRLPARWQPAGSARARELLTRAQDTMRALPSLRETERVTSGPGTGAVTRYRLRAPDRLAFATDQGVAAVRVGTGEWLRVPGGSWRRRESAGRFSTRAWWRWTPYAQTVQLIGRRPEGGRAITEIALMDPTTPVWIRLWIDARSGRVGRERMVSRARLTTSRFWDVGGDVEIRAPRAVGP